MTTAIYLRGIHPATLPEIEARFGREPELRRAEMQSLHWLMDIARRAGVKRIVLNGSFVTDRYEPNDMELTNERQAVNTRKKLDGLENHYTAAVRDLSPDDRVRLISLQSIKRMINQLKEELARYEARAVSKK